MIVVFLLPKLSSDLDYSLLFFLDVVETGFKLFLVRKFIYSSIAWIAALGGHPLERDPSVLVASCLSIYFR